MSEDNITEQEAQEIVRAFGEGKANLHSFFNNVVKTPDTTKTGNLDSTELGMPKLPLRTYKELALFCKDVAGQDSFSDYFNKMAEIQTSTSLSKDALLLKLAVTIKKELADTTPQRKKNRGMFGFGKEKEDDKI
jgi:hypothetical protein